VRKNSAACAALALRSDIGALIFIIAYISIL